jgi:uncharacterized protein with HEPN domain
MRPRTAVLLEDIRDAAQFILDETNDVTLEDYEADRRLRRAVERSFEIMGEAMRRLQQADPPTAKQFPTARIVVDFRNVLIHGYDIVENEIVWRTIQDSLPDLVRELERVLSTVEVD